ncbi:DUF2214 family protein [Pseudomonas paraeruginosa]|uniref:DUF2214 family protein n=1 Tax=Pseudomonas aeruginosa TaxID=287 RepID=A0ABD7K316_PSEAI|nr:MULTISPECIES: DUF2214 family protein [Pseudomonas aeruginosa group]KFF33195.1 membrane protein [Pseudomonas aeruginosa VRFPA01]MBG5753129.1 DUF2214 family protein [Pseudomonas aeruginosa]RTR97763.1 DUF2214 family protein [Pseudomonas paraeruginosa]RTS46358.1 DUF2214 family protein [Pseudomonas aeruginosa]
MAQAIAAYLHYLSIFLLFALLVLQHRLLRLPLDLERARSLAAIDRGYGLCALAVLASGLARVLWYGKGVDYYLHNGVFHAKVGLFVLAALVSLLPTVTFLGWRGALKAGEVPVVAPAQGRQVVLAIRLQLLLLLVIPLLASLMARGIGLRG